jgi:hypothetical protein
MELVYGVGAALITFIIGFVLGKQSSERQQRVAARRKKPVANDNSPLQQQSEERSADEVEMKLTIVRAQPEEEVDIDSVNRIDADHTDIKSASVVVPQAQSEMVAVNGVGYLSTPNANAEFDDAMRHEECRPGLSIYCVRYTNELKTAGTFTLVESDDAFDLVIRRRELVLDPVAEMTNSYPKDARSIINEIPGEIELQSGTWKVRKKLQARYQ